jgi:tubulin epsilon
MAVAVPEQNHIHAVLHFSPECQFAQSSFFRNVDARVEPYRNLPVGDGKGEIRTLKVGVVWPCTCEQQNNTFDSRPPGVPSQARSVIVDMECGVINEMLKVRNHSAQLHASNCGQN